jgi:hypothetical protein
MAYNAKKEIDALKTAHVELREEMNSGHGRLRDTLRNVGESLDEYWNCQQDLKLKVRDLANAQAAPPDLSKSVIPTKLWLSIIGLCAVIVGAAYSVKSDVRDIVTAHTAEQKLTDERNAAQKTFNEDLKKDFALQRIQLESLTKMVISQQRREAR